MDLAPSPVALCFACSHVTQETVQQFFGIRCLPIWQLPHQPPRSGISARPAALLPTPNRCQKAARWFVQEIRGSILPAISPIEGMERLPTGNQQAKASSSLDGCVNLGSAIGLQHTFRKQV